MFVKSWHISATAVGAMLVATFVSGCATVGTNPSNEPTMSVTIPVDTSKSLQQQADEVITAYCKVRDTPAASAVAESAKRLMNALIAEAQRQGVQIPMFDPGNPKTCQGK